MRLLLVAALLLLTNIAYAVGYNAPSVGTRSTAAGTLTPGQPAGKAAGDLLVLITAANNDAETPTTPTGYTFMCDSTATLNGSLAVYVRIATNDASDNISADIWSGGSASFAQLASFGGSVWAGGLGSILISCNARGTTSATANLPSPSLTVGTANALVIAVGRKTKSATSNGLTATSPTGLSNRISLDVPSGSSLWSVWDYTQQTTATNISQDFWTQSVSESAAWSSIVLALKSGNPPTYSVAPAIGTRTTSTIPITQTSACTDCTAYGVAVPDGSGTPTCTQIKAGQDATSTTAYKSFSGAVTASTQFTGTFSTYTSGTVRDGYFCLNSTAGGDSAVSSIADMYKLPAFSAGPTFSSAGTGGVTYSATLDGAGTLKGVACTKGSTAPTVTQVEAGQCTGSVTAQASASKSVTGADTLTIGTALSLPYYDFYINGTYGSQHEASVHSDLARLLAAPAGKQYVTIASVDSTSFCADFNATQSPTIAANDIIKLDTLTSPGNHAITLGTDCTLSYGGSDSSRQLVHYDIYDASVGSYMSGGPGNLWFNNQAPVAPVGTLVFFVPLNAPMTPTNLSTLCTDAENDTITVTAVDSLPTGLTISANVIQGTATVQGITKGIRLSCTDITGESTVWQ